MQVKSFAACYKGKHSATHLAFIKLPFAINIFVLSLFEWPFYTGFNVRVYSFSFRWCVETSVAMVTDI